MEITRGNAPVRSGRSPQTGRRRSLPQFASRAASIARFPPFYSDASSFFRRRPVGRCPHPAPSTSPPTLICSAAGRYPSVARFLYTRHLTADHAKLKLSFRMREESGAPVSTTYWHRYACVKNSASDTSFACAARECNAPVRSASIGVGIGGSFTLS